jgi:hypothetical protein
MTYINNKKNFSDSKFFCKCLAFFLWILIGWGWGASTGFTEITSVPATDDKARLVLAPYAQSVPNDSYTFISINHSSLDTSLTQVGVAIEVLGMTTVPNTTAGQAAIFTIDAGETHRLFIVNVSHPTINASNSSFNDPRTHIIYSANSAQFGNIRAVSVNEKPIVPTTINSIKKYNNLSQLSFWGIVFIESSGTGFAMEFIGDAHDSTIGRNFGDSQLSGVSGTSSGVARGIN